MTFDLTPDEARYILALLVERPIREAWSLAQKWEMQMKRDKVVELRRTATAQANVE